MKKNKKIVLLLLILLLIIVFINNNVLAITINTNESDPGRVNTDEATKITDAAGRVLAAIRNVGAAISVIVLSIIGLKYMLCSVEEKANYKENMIPYVIGCTLLLMATTIPSLIYSVMN